MLFNLRLANLARHTRFWQFIKFCLVGGSGVMVDMTLLYILADRNGFGWNVTLSKVCSAEMAMINNYIWNELWTFRGPFSNGITFKPGTLGRFFRFHAICGIGIVLAVILLHGFHQGLGFNLYLANLLAIILVTLWNFWINAAYNWRAESKPAG